jgi:hypothetical protein
MRQDTAPAILATNISPPRPDDKVQRPGRHPDHGILGVGQAQKAGERALLFLAGLVPGVNEIIDVRCVNETLFVQGKKTRRVLAKVRRESVSLSGRALPARRSWRRGLHDDVLWACSIRFHRAAHSMRKVIRSALANAAHLYKAEWLARIEKARLRNRYTAQSDAPPAGHSET